MNSEAMSGKKIGVGVATTYDSYLEGKLSLQDESGNSEAIKSVITNPSVRTYETDALALQDLSLGDGQRLDGAITATPIVQGAIDSDTVFPADAPGQGHGHGGFFGGLFGGGGHGGSGHGGGHHGGFWGGGGDGGGGHHGGGGDGGGGGHH